MKRLLLAVVALLLIAFVARALVRLFASDETKIRWALEEMRDGFNDTKLAPVVDRLHPMFREEQSGADLDLVEQALISVYFSEIDATTKSFALRVESDFDAWTVEVAEPDGDSPASARAAGDFAMFRRKGGQETLLWRARAALELSVDDEDGWQVLRASLDTLEGDRRLR
ncbi:MAG: hypothetical protein FJ299_08415 [Planctomycetes bacterium]|nr:hypothetical protein [Planctomycetota bacterium]